MNEFQSRLQHALDADFLIERELGGAGMSRVFVATERALQRKVVIKVLPPELAAGVNVDRFRREIQLAAQLQHPHIVPLLAAGDDDGLLWFSMPYIEGESLRGALERRKRLPAGDVVRILHDVVDALAYAHARGIVHRDIKPENILTSGLHALVTDFGVAKALSMAIPVHGNTATGMAIGTPAYMAPEQLAADPAADHRVDIYAVGLLAYELLTGASPFSGKSPQATLAAQLTQRPEPPHRTNADIPEALSALIMHCLEKDASKRPATAAELRTEVEALAPMSSYTALSRYRPRRIAWVASLLGITTIATLAYALYGRSNGTTPLEAQLRARDAGRTGGASPMDPDTSAARLQANQPGDTTPVFREVGDGKPTTTLQFVITRAESLAIADAVLKRQAADATRRRSEGPGATQRVPGAASSSMPTMTATGSAAARPGSASHIIVRAEDGSTMSIDRDLLLAEVARFFADSMSRAQQHMDQALANTPRITPVEPPRPQSGFTFSPMLPPPTGNRLRIVVQEFGRPDDRREFSSISRELTRRLRELISADRFEVVDAAITERAARMSSNRMALGWSLRADYVVSGRLSVQGDSAVVLAQMTDVRDGRFSRVFESTAALRDIRSTIDPTERRVMAWLDTAATMFSRRIERDSGGGPTRQSQRWRPGWY